MPRPLYPSERAFSTHWITRWVGLRFGRDGHVGEINVLGSAGSEWSPVAVFCKHGDEHLTCIKGSEFLYKQSDCQLRKNNFCWVIDWLIDWLDLRKRSGVDTILTVQHSHTIQPFRSVLVSRRWMPSVWFEKSSVWTMPAGLCIFFFLWLYLVSHVHLLRTWQHSLTLAHFILSWSYCDVHVLLTTRFYIICLCNQESSCLWETPFTSHIPVSRIGLKLSDNFSEGNCFFFTRSICYVSCAQN